jgi:dihydrofolate reductase
MIKSIAAISKNRVLGNQGTVPWHVPEDLKRVSNLTRNHFLLMGRATFDSLPERFKPLPHRISIVVSRGSIQEHPLVQHAKSIERALEIYYSQATPAQNLWIFGGGQIYQQTLDLWEELYLTVVDIEVEGDTFFPPFEDKFKLVEMETKGIASFQRHVLNNSPVPSLLSSTA